MDTYTDNILSVYHGTDSRLPSRSHADHCKLRSIGTRWYRDNRRMIRAVADDTGYHRSVVAAVFAAYSINNRWSSNVMMAHRAIVNHAIGRPIIGLPISVRLASAALESGHGNIILSMIGPSARKVRTFYAAFLGMASVRPVIDRWANYIATGDKTVPNGKRYELVASHYVEAASIIGIRPEELQAAAWTILRGSAN